MFHSVECPGQEITKLRLIACPLSAAGLLEHTVKYLFQIISLQVAEVLAVLTQIVEDELLHLPS